MLEPTSLFPAPTPALEPHSKPYTPPRLELLGPWSFRTGAPISVGSGGRVFLPLDPP